MAGKMICVKEGLFMWTIDNFIVFSRHGYAVDSPKFCFKGILFRMTVRRFTEEKRIVVSFISRSTPIEKHLHIKIWINAGYVGKPKKESRIFNGSFRIIAVSFPDIPSSSSDMCVDGRLTIFCELRTLDEYGNHSGIQQKSPNVATLSKGEDIQVESESPEKNSSGKETVSKSEERRGEKRAVVKEVVSESKALKKLQEDLNNLFMSGEDCDVTLKVQSKEFHAHKNILRARSPVFRSMFNHEMAEKRNGVVTINDCDPGTFPDFLYYLYTGRTKHINDKNVCQLFIASDKYQVEELKEECSDFMKYHLSVETFCEFFTLALKHTEEELTDLATIFFCDNAAEIVKTAKWQIFLDENSTVGNELFLKALSRGRN